MTILGLLVLLLAAHLGGVFARRLGQPAVIGQLAAGVVVGPTVLGNASGDVLTHGAISTAKDLGTIGLVCFAFVLGARLERSHLPLKGQFAAVATSVFVVPFAAGAGVALLLYGRHHQVSGTIVDRLPFVLFIGAAVSITAFPVLARIIDDHNLRTTRVGTLALSCAAVNDALSWIALALALIAYRGSAGSLELVRLLGGGCGLVAVLALLAYVADRRRIPVRSWTVLAVPACLAGAALATSEMGLHYIFGAFAFGVVAGRPSLAALSTFTVRLSSPVAAVLLPLYLALPGATTDFRELDLHAGGEVLLVIGAAAAAKIAAGTLSAQAIGFPWREAASFGLLVDTRGLVELVALAIGRSAGILDTRLYAVLLIMAVVTTVATSPGLRLLQRPR